MKLNLIEKYVSNNLINCLLPLAVGLQLSKDNRELSLLAFFTWIVLQLSARIVALISNGSTRETWLSWTAILGLILFNARNIILRDNYRGSTIFLLIGVGLLLGSQFDQKQWRNLSTWLSISIIPIALFFAIQLGIQEDWSFKSFYGTYYALTQPSMGSINRLATLATFSTIASWYNATLANKIWSKCCYLLLAAIGYWITLGTDSRMAIAAIPVAIAIPWLGLRLAHRLSRKQLIFSLFTAVSLFALGAWELVIKAGLNSDHMRLRMANCWIRQGMFRSLKRIWFGSGFDTSSIREACHYVRPGQSFGHAHNTFAQIAGNHGLLGLIVLFAFTTLIVHGLWRQLHHFEQRLDWSPWSSTVWAEISLGLNLALLFCALSTTVQEFSPVNQLLIGLVGGSACVALPTEKPPHQGMLENQTK
ncbi:MAG: Uncharacterised protein [Prochlorococcus marinus str. MIT 9215]|nr:MAG: Uncharacterised protein [Prochlorococcus marinus str. MIT 9215]